MKKLFLIRNNGIYDANIDISISEWKEMLINKKIFNEPSLQMIRYWYEQLDYKATNKEIMIKYNIPQKTTPFNGIVKGLGKRIIKYLNRFEIVDTNGSKSYFVIPFKGWYEDYDKNKNFVWKLRDELIQAIDELKIFPESTFSVNDELQNINIIEETPEGKKRVSYVTTYERSNKNRNAAIKIHGTKCLICGFDFEKTYGEIGKDFIEIHHIKPLHENQKEVLINPKEDLICICSNCHRMIHRRKDKVLSPTELKTMISNNK